MGNQNNFPPIKEGSVVLVTGGSSGLGKQIVLKLALKKVTLIIAARNIDRLYQTKKQCQELGCMKVITFQGDLTQPQVCKNLIQLVQKRYRHLDFLVLNAGVNAHFRFQELKDFTVFQQLMRTNFFSNAYLTKAALPLIKKSKGGIVVISSLSGKFGLPMRSAYCASKFALNGFFESLRTEEKIPILMVYPTSLQTPMRQNSLIKAESHATEKRQDPKECAQLLIKGIDAQKEQVYMPWKGWVGVIMQPLFPKLLRWKVSRAAKL